MKLRKRYLVCVILILITSLAILIKINHSNKNEIQRQKLNFCGVTDSLYTFKDKYNKLVCVTQELNLTNEEVKSSQLKQIVELRNELDRLKVKPKKVIQMTGGQVIITKTDSIIITDTVFKNIKFKTAFIDSCFNETINFDSNKLTRSIQANIPIYAYWEKYRVGKWHIKNLFIWRKQSVRINAKTGCDNVNLQLYSYKIIK